MDEKDIRNNGHRGINDICVGSNGALNSGDGGIVADSSNNTIDNLSHSKPKEVAEFPQFDEGMMAWPCRSANDTAILEKRLPERIKRSLERHKISLYDAIYYARTKKYKKSRLSKKAFEELVVLLYSMNYFRRDFRRQVSFAYAKLMRDAGIPNDYIVDVSEITDNVMYETCSIPGVDEMKAFDLRMENRLNYRSQFILRRIYGLDGERYSTYDVAAIYNKIVMEGKSKEYFEHRKDFLTRINVIRVEYAVKYAKERLREECDDKHEYIAKLAKRLYDATKMPEGGEKKEFDDALIESLTSDILLTSKMF